MSSTQQLATFDAPLPNTITTAAGERQILVFRLATVHFGVDAASVCEMHFLPELAPLEEAPPAIAGLLNLRGKLVPVIDLDVIFNRPRRPANLSQGIVVVELDDEMFALIVDEVESVASAATADLREVPRIGRPQEGHVPCVQGLLRWNEQVVMLLNLEQLWRAAYTTTEGHAQWEPPPGTWEPEPFSPPSETEYLRDAPAEAIEFRARARHLMRAAHATDSASGLFAMALVILGGETFGVSLTEMREFTDLRWVSPVPCCPEHILGQMNLRGDVVTLVDVRPLLNLPPRGVAQGGQVLVVQYQEAPVGILLDEVVDVIYLPPEAVVSAAQAGSNAGRYFNGGAFHSGKMVCLLDVNRLLSEGIPAVDETL